MRRFILIWKREVMGYFLSPVAYVVSIFFLLIMGYSFWLLCRLLADGKAGVAVMSELFGSFFFWLPMLVVAPLLTMRLIAEEKRSGTLETLLTAPVGDAPIVLGKFAGALTFFVAMWLPTATYAVILGRFSAESAPVDPGPMLAGYLGTLLIGAFYLSAGVLCSALTSNQILAAVMTFSLLAAVFFTGFLGEVTHSELLRQVCNYVSSVKHMQDFARGAVDSRPVVFYLSGTAFLLFTAIRAVESRHWK